MKMKKMMFLMLTLFFLGSASMNAQVTIGSDKVPHSGAVLDLQSDNLGLKLPKVALRDVLDFQLGNGASSNDAIGMMVYNTSATTINGNGTGIYIWDNKWIRVGVVSVSNFTLTSSSGVSLNAGAETVITASNFTPANVMNQNVTWRVLAGSGQIISSTGTTCTVRVGAAGTSLIIQAQSLDMMRIVNIALLAGINGEPQWGAGAQGVSENYKSILYPAPVGEWMAASSREGNPANKTFNNGEHTDNTGYYYHFDELQFACPSGWSIPSPESYAILRSFVSTLPSNSEFRRAWISTDGYASYGAAQWGGYGSNTRYWVDNGQWFNYVSSGLVPTDELTRSIVPNALNTVRCKKN